LKNETITQLRRQRLCTAPRQPVIDTLGKQDPNKSRVHHKMVTGWCMAPIKSKRKEVMESFLQQCEDCALDSIGTVPYRRPSIKFRADEEK
jgi:hypothetical protein